MKEDDLIVDKEILSVVTDKNPIYDFSWRVKFFELNADNTWLDKGTGQARIQQHVLFFFNVRMTPIIYMWSQKTTEMKCSNHKSLRV